GQPRNRFAAHMHGVLGRDHTSPLDLLADGRRELARYDTVEVRTGGIASATVVDGGFDVVLDSGATLGTRRILLATGLRDDLPAIPGLAEQWGRGVVVCPYCDGWEVRDRRIAIIAGGPTSTHQAQLMRQLSADVTYVVNGSSLPDESRVGLLARGIAIEERAAAAIETDVDDSLTGIRLADGTLLAVDAVFAAPRPQPLDALARSLGATIVDRQGASWLDVDAMGRTSVPGLWAAGNVTDARSSVPFAMAAGNMAGAGLNADLVDEDVRAASAGAGRLVP
ncbi:MAG: NAD(P)/FAD-dependent oxidoreductase, partial [Leifsonia sp.]